MTWFSGKMQADHAQSIDGELYTPSAVYQCIWKCITASNPSDWTPATPPPSALQHKFSPVSFIDYTSTGTMAPENCNRWDLGMVLVAPFKQTIKQTNKFEEAIPVQGIFMTQTQPCQCYYKPNIGQKSFGNQSQNYGIVTIAFFFLLVQVRIQLR